MFDDRHWPEPLPLTAEGGVTLLEQAYALWRGGIAALDDDDLLRPLGPKGGPFADDSMAALAMHLNWFGAAPLGPAPAEPAMARAA